MFATHRSSMYVFERETKMYLNKDLIAASATPLILSILRHGDSYGYDIIRQIEALSEGEMQWAEGMLYPILHRLEKNGWVESYWGKAENGRRRKYYRICQTGAKELSSQRASWEKLFGMIQKLEKEGIALCSI